MNQRIILVDMDGPLADLEGAFLRIWQEQYPDEFFVPFEERRTFYLNDDYPEHLKNKLPPILAADGFFAALEPVEAGIQALEEMQSLGHRIIVCTSDIFANKTGLSDKRKWIHRYLGLEIAKAMIFTRDKTLVHGDYLIDDKPSITGIGTPNWIHVIYDQPFNRDIGDKPRMSVDWSNWKKIIQP